MLYQLETILVPIIDKNTQAQSYIHLHVDRAYIALNSETYNTVREQELRTCKRIGYEFYCEELFLVEHKFKYSCKIAIYFDWNKTDITPTVLDGGNKIILANWPND